MIIVSDTSPISNLALVGQLTLLQQIYRQIVIPSAVYRELSDQGAGEIVSTAVNTSTWIVTKSVTDRTMVETLQDRLDKGEAEAIVLAIELEADELLLDERLARREATRLGVSITGVLGVLLIAKRRGIITAVKPVMDELIAQAFRVSNQLYNETLYLADE